MPQKIRQVRKMGLFIRNRFIVVWGGNRSFNVEPWEFLPGISICYVAAPDGVSIELIQAYES